MRNFDYGLTSPVEVSIIDNIMGSGKTTKMIEKIKLDIATKPEQPILIVVPYLDEIRRYLVSINGLDHGRIDEWMRDEEGNIIIGKDNKIVFDYNSISQLRDTGFKMPIVKSGKSKTTNLRELLRGCNNIITTHSLYTQWDEGISDMIRSGQYRVIVDEELEAFRSINISRLGRQEAKALIEDNYITVNEEHKVVWNEDKDERDGSFTGNDKYREIRKYALDGDLYIYGDLLKEERPFIAWSVPKSFYCCASSYHIMTYRFQASFLAAYFKHNNIPFTFESRAKTSIYDDIELKSKARELIEIVSTPKSLVGRGTMYSHSYLNSLTKEEIDKTKKALTDTLTRTYKVPATDLLMTHSQQFAYYDDKTKTDAAGNYIKNNRKDKKILTPTKYKDCHVAFSCKGTNDFSNRNFVVYLHNVYPNSAISRYMKDKNIPFDEEEYALSVMLQFIWRSAIRKGEAIKLMIPSLRMHRMFTEWLGKEEEILNGISAYELISDTGEVVKFYNQDKFCEERSLDSTAISRVLAGERMTHKGWRLNSK